MITRVDAARICACAEEAERAVDKFIEQVDDVMTDDDVANPSYDLMRGTGLKAKAAKKELGKAMEFAVAARKVAGR